MPGIGDDIGKETVPEGVRVLDAATARFGSDVAQCDQYLEHRRCYERADVLRQEVLFSEEREAQRLLNVLYLLNIK